MIRPIKYIIAPAGEIYDDSVLHIEIEDHGGGEFITISQPPDFHKVSINPREWPELLEALYAMLAYTADLNANQGFDEYDHAAVKNARAAIRKAKGEV